MKTPQTSALPAPPSLLASLMGGFDTAAKKVHLILFPLALDLIIWLGPHIRLQELLNRFSESLLKIAAAAALENGDTLRANQEMWAFMGERLNLLASLRTFPVGIPSLMAARLPLQRPAGLPALEWEIVSWGGVTGIWLLLSVVGLVVGSLFWMSAARAAVPQPANSEPVDLPWAALQVFLLTLLWLALIILLSFPVICLLSVLLLITPGLSNIAALLLLTGLIWFLFPFFLSPHGIFLARKNALASMKKSWRLTRMTLPSTSLFFLIVFLLSQGMDTLWRVPPENSWITLIGLFGHAFITTGLLAASFIYYRAADQFSHKMTSYWLQAR